MTATRRGLAAAVAAVGLTLGSGALAQTASSDAAELFRQGRVALESKAYATACSKLAQSLRLERAVGTLISLAECEQASGKLTAARQHWQEAADFADAIVDPLHRGPYAREQFAGIDARVPRITVHPAPGTPPNASLKRDDVDLGTSAFDAPLPVDPGAHALTLSAPGHAPRTITVDVQEREHRELVVEPGPLLPEAPEAPLAVSPAQAASDGHTQRVLAYVIGGVGVAGIAAGSVFGLYAGSKWSQAKDTCGASCPPTSPAVSERSTAEGFATASTITLAAGAVALAVGIVLLLTTPDPSKPPPAALWMAPALGGLTVGGGS